MIELIIRAYDDKGYHLDILEQDERQIWQSDQRVKNGLRGVTIDPKDFPEMVKFEVIFRESIKR